MSGGYEGWINPDGSQQQIAIARFSTVKGATTAVDDLSSDLADQPAPCTMFAGPSTAQSVRWTRAWTPTGTPGSKSPSESGMS